jgi:hypothetical protein
MAKSQSSDARQKKFSLPLVSAPLAAGVLDISRRQFDRLLASKVLARAAGESRRFDLFEIVRAYVRYVQDGKEATSEVAQARLKYVNAQRRSVEQRTRERGGELVERGDVARVFDAVMVQVGAALEGLPGRMAGELAAINEPAVVREKLSDEVRRIRATAAEELAALASRGERSSATEAAPEAHGRSVGRGK